MKEAVIRELRTLQQALEEGLITPEEHNERRQALLDSASSAEAEPSQESVDDAGSEDPAASTHIASKTPSTSPLKKGLMIAAGLSLLVGLGLWMYGDDRQSRRSSSRDDDRDSSREESSSSQKEPEPDKLVLEQELAELQEELRELRKELPNEGEITEYLKGVSDRANAVGLEVRGFARLDEVPLEDLVEVPVSIEVYGGYHQVAEFFDQLSEMRRIVYVQDITIGSPEFVGDDVFVTATGHAVTFRLYSNTELAEKEGDGKNGQKATRQRSADLETRTAQLERTKGTIQVLKTKKYGPVRMLDEIAKASPETLRLMSIEEKKNGEVSLLGRAFSNDVIAEFAHQLDSSPFFEEVYINTSEQELEGGVKVKEFSITARLLAGSVDESYRYDADGKRDPFTPFLRLIEIASASCQESPLQCYELSEYRMAAAIVGIDRPRGMVVDPTGEHYVVEIGDYIGKKGGQVSKIESERIEVTEEYESSEGDLLVTKKSLSPSDGGASQ